MTKIRLKAAPRKTQVSRAKVRGIMSRLFAGEAIGSKRAAIKKSQPKTATHKTVTRKTVSRSAA